MRTTISMIEYADLVDKYLGKDKVKNIVEIGSLNAADAQYLNSRFDAKTFAIEGNPDNFEKYMKDLTDITPIQKIVYTYDGEIEYNIKEVNGIHGVRDRGQQYGSTKITAPCSTYATIAKEYGIENIDVLKLDVEGCTYELLESLGDELPKIKIMHVETETVQFFEGQKLHNDVLELLDKDFIMVDSAFVQIGHGRQYDTVWVNKEVLND